MHDLAPSNPSDISTYVRWFHSFSEAFLQGTAEDKWHIQTKIEHSIRVLSASKIIINWLNLEHPLDDICQIGALLHDVGRFEQYANFKTFNDRISVNHGIIGVQTIKNSGILHGIQPDHRRMILATVLLHNRHQLPSKLPPKLDLMLRIVRDADKLDIMGAIIDYFSSEKDNHSFITGLKSHAEEYTLSILENLRSGQPVQYGDLVWVNDFKLLVCGWMLDFCFKISIKTALDSGYLSKLFALLPQKAEVQSLRQTIQKHLSIRAINRFQSL
jgi:HD superfamily phosphodiesterase